MPGQATVSSNYEFYESPVRYRISDDDRLIETTISEREPEPNWLKPTPGNRTLPESSRLKGRQISLAVEEVGPVAPVEPQQSQVSGVVLQADETSVKCEIYLDASNVQVQLPRALFPEKISYGLPILLEMIEDRGIRQPRISMRQADTEKFKELKAEVAAILEEF